jgi:hypothetical protein
MAIYISIRKVKEDATFVEYVFGTSDNELGRMKLSKSSGAVQLIQPAPNDREERLFRRAAHKIETHWKKGELPGETCWAS